MYLPAKTYFFAECAEETPVTLWSFVTVCELEHDQLISIVELPSYKMVDLSSSLCNKLPSPFWCYWSG